VPGARCEAEYVGSGFYIVRNGAGTQFGGEGNDVFLRLGSQNPPECQLNLVGPRLVRRRFSQTF